MSEVKWPAALVRKTFFDYFKERGHTIGTHSQLALPFAPAFTTAARP